ASRANEVRLQAELQAAKEQIQHLAAALEQEKCARAEAALATQTKKAEASPRSPRTPKSPQRVARAPASPRRAESRGKEPDDHRGSRSGDVAPAARPLGERRVTRRGSSPAALRRLAKDEVDTKLTEYLASSPHCQLEFCRLNQGWYQFRHVDAAMETKCLEMSIVNGKLMVKFEPTNHDRG
ncbi:unnamed protein product, partial [Symbiodinium sp. CCMP2456]